MVNIFYFKDEEADEKEYLLKNIGYLDGIEWLHNNCESIGADGFYFKGKLCLFEHIKE